MVAAPVQTDCEYTFFTYQDWSAGDTWACVADRDRSLIPQAQHYFWSKIQSDITQELDTWAVQGWEPVDEICPEAIKLRRSEYTLPAFDLEDVFLWIITLGFALIAQLLLGKQRRYFIYTPVEFRVRMRRFVSYPLPLAG